MLIYLNQWHPISLKCMRNKDMKNAHFNISTFNHYKTVIFVFIKNKENVLLCSKYFMGKIYNKIYRLY